MVSPDCANFFNLILILQNIARLCQGNFKNDLLYDIENKKTAIPKDSGHNVWRAQMSQTINNGRFAHCYCSKTTVLLSKYFFKLQFASWDLRHDEIFKDARCVNLILNGELPTKL